MLQKTGVQEASSLEGFLFPETYFFSKIDSERRILQNMIRHYRNAYSREFEIRAKELGMTEYQILILASIIEKEGKKLRDLMPWIGKNKLVDKEKN